MSVTIERPNEVDRMRFFINGEWAEPSTVRIQHQIEAATGEVIGAAALGSEADIDAAVKAARGALDNGPWGRSTAAERAATLRKFAEALERRATDTSKLVSRENGPPFGRGTSKPGRFNNRPSRTSGRGRCHSTLELPAGIGDVQDCPCPGRRLHCRSQTIPGNRAGLLCIC